MALASNIALARVLAGFTGEPVKLAAQREEWSEREQEIARAIKGQERGRKAQRQMGRGRLFGGLAGGVAGSILLKLATGALAGTTGGLSLLALQGLTKGAPLLRALATAVGGRKGAKVATGTEDILGVTGRKLGFGRGAAREELKPIGVGTFQRGRGRERETEFRAGERAFREDLATGIDAQAINDFMSALAFQSLLPGLFGKATRAFGGPAFRGGQIPFQQSLKFGGELPGPFLPRSLAGLSDIQRGEVIQALRSLSPRR